MSEHPYDPNLAPAVSRLRVVFAATTASEDETRWLLAAATALHARGHAVAVATDAQSALAASAAERGLETRALRTGARLDPRVGRAARAAMGECDAVVALDPAALALAHRAGAPLAFARTEQASEWAARTPFAAAVLVPPGARVDSATNGDDNRAPVRTIADAIAADAARPDPIAVRRALRLPRRVHLALHVAPLVPGAGHDLLLRALTAPEFEAKAAPLVVAFFGTGPEESRLRVLSQDLGVKERVLWLGLRADVTSYVAAADSLLIPGAIAPPRRVLLDALTFGIPILALDTESARARFEPAARFLPGDDSAAWAAALRSLYTVDSAAAQSALPAATATMSPTPRRHRVAAEWSPAALAADLECAVYAYGLRQRPAPARRRALFLDRDGTLVRNVPYNADPNAVVMEPRAGRALRWARDAGFALVVTSNQSGIGRGRVTPAQVEAIHARIRSDLSPYGADLDAMYYCPHLPEADCACRKPRPGLLQQAADQLGLDLAHSVGIGDAPRDVLAAHAAGARARGYRGDVDDTPVPRGAVAGHDALDTGAPAATAWPDGVRVHDDWLELVRDVLAEAWAEGR
jgi:histidinol-phosphate phosphatase family protein